MRFLSIGLVLSTIASTPRQDGPARAQELLEGVAIGLKDSPAIACECRVRLKMQTIEVRQTANVILERPHRARLEIAGAGQDALIVLDGSSQWHYLKARKKFLKSKQLGTTKIEQYGAGPLASLFFEKGTGSILPYLSASRVTRETLGNEECSVVSWNVGEEETRLWIAGARLVQFRITRSIAGEKTEQTIEYGPVDTHPRLPEGAFAFTPPEGAQPIEKSGVSGLLAVGADAPDVVATDLRGKETRLSEFKGKPVILTFWFFG